MDERPDRTSDARARMVEAQLRARDIKDPRVLAAMAAVPRESFVPDRERAAAYQDGPLPIGAGQTISQPYMVARMTELIHVAAGRARPRRRHRAPATRRRSSPSSAAR